MYLLLFVCGYGVWAGKVKNEMQQTCYMVWLGLQGGSEG